MQEFKYHARENGLYLVAYADRPWDIVARVRKTVEWVTETETRPVWHAFITETEGRAYGKTRVGALRAALAA